MNTKLLKLLNRDARTEPADLAVMLGMTEEEVRREIDEMEAAGIIRGYKAVIDWERLNDAYVSAIIELKVTPQYNRGFDAIAERIYNYPEVQSVYLMSGAYDLCVILEGKTIREVALFVAQRLAPLEAVLSTATHFVLRKYKDKGVIYGPANFDERGNCN